MSHDMVDNQPTSGYIQIRLTVPHDYIKDVIECVNDSMYCIYLHKGKSGDNEHMHICIPGDVSDAFTEKYRKRIKKRFGIKGNERLSLKRYQTRLHSFIFYGAHEGTEAIYEDDRWRGIIEEQMKEDPPVFKKQSGQTMLPMEKRKKDLDADWSLTYANMVPKAVNYARNKGLTGCLKEVLQDMLENTKWKPSYHMVRNGVPDHYFKDFEFRTGKRAKYDMDWMKPKF